MKHTKVRPAKLPDGAYSDVIIDRALGYYEQKSRAAKGYVRCQGKDIYSHDGRCIQALTDAQIAYCQKHKLPELCYRHQPRHRKTDIEKNT